MIKSTYSNKLKNPLWQRKRLEVFQFDDFTCRNCGDTETELQVHHIDYLPGLQPWEYPLSMLMTLCSNCHAKEQGRNKVENYLITTLKMKGFMLGDLLHLSCLIDNDIDFTKTLLKTLRANESKTTSVSTLCERFLSGDK